MKTGINRIKFQSNKLSLEGILVLPDKPGPLPAVIVCHPHPLYGGSMDNNVVNSVCKALTQASFISLKFNFRGVGGSEGKFSQGIGEQEDVAAAISFLTTLEEIDSEKVGLTGYSAGAAFALPIGIKDPRVKALAAISLPLSMFNADLLRDCLKPKLFISGSSDDFTSASQFLEFYDNIPKPKEYHIIKGADHSWWGYEPDLAAEITAFFTTALKP